MNLTIPLCVILLILLIIFALLATQTNIPLIKIGGRQKTYLFSGNTGIIYDRLRELLEQNGYVAYSKKDYADNGIMIKRTDKNRAIKYVDLLVMELVDGQACDHNAYYIKCDWQSIHSADSEYPLVMKDRLHKSLRDTGLVAKTWELSEFEYFNGVYIIRPAHMFASSGRDIKVVSTKEEFNAAKQFYESEIEKFSKYRQKHIQNYNVIVSEYISRPMLFEGRKFHLRLYGISLSTRPDEYHISRAHGKILTAAKPYIQGDWDNKEIHDTHLNSTIRDLIYPDDFNRQDLIEDINKQLDNFETHIAKITTPIPYDHVRRSFSVYGIDVMITEEGRLVLIEINDRPGFRFLEPGGKKHIELSKRHCEWIASFIL